MSPTSLPAPLDKRRKAGGKTKGTRRTKIAAAPDLREQFVFHYVQTALLGRPNGSEAARLAGYSHKTAGQTAYELLKDPDVREAIYKLSAESTRGMEYDGERIKQELASIAFSPVTPGYIRASDKKAALELLGVNLKLWEGSRGDKIININILQIDEKTL